MKTLREIMRHGFLFMVQPKATVAEAARLMAAHNIGIVCVLDGDRLVGVFSERDVVRRVVDRGLACPLLCTGSSRFHLRAKTRESLAGRARRARVFPFSLAEICQDLDGQPAPIAAAIRLERMLRHAVIGGYPLVWAAEDPGAGLAALLEAVVIRDASDVHRVARRARDFGDDDALFAELFEETFGDLEGPPVRADILPQEEDPLILVHLLPQGLADRLEVCDLFHPRQPSAVSRQRSVSSRWGGWQAGC
jgi:hypothetical protein